jgi:hypothetical protein
MQEKGVLSEMIGGEIYNHLSDMKGNHLQYKLTRMRNKRLNDLSEIKFIKEDGHIRAILGDEDDDLDDNRVTKKWFGCGKVKQIRMKLTMPKTGVEAFRMQ